MTEREILEARAIIEACRKLDLDESISSRQGQRFLRDLLDALDSLAYKLLDNMVLIGEFGEVCALGSMLVHQGIDPHGISPGDFDRIAVLLDTSVTLVEAVVTVNDERDSSQETGESRWRRVHDWATSKLQTED